MNVDLSALMTKPAPDAAQARTAKSATDVDYQSFLKLLVAQMKNQDPTSPMETTAYQSVQMNAKLAQLMQSSSLAEADAIIGRTITSPDATVSGKVVEVTLSSTGLVATLADGRTLPVTAGVRIS